MNILVTGAAGFIGSHLVKKLLSAGHYVVGVDSMNDYYDVNLKWARLQDVGILQSSEAVTETGETSQSNSSYRFVQLDLNNRASFFNLLEAQRFDVVCHLAAQTGVRYSLENPHVYIDSNVSAFMNILEGCRKFPVKHLVYASSSSVYGDNREVPFSTGQKTDSPISVYAATKKANELLAHSYCHLYDIPTTGLRFFTVYGPWGRPDMAYFKFADKIMAGQPIDIYNNGEMKRDFTYVDDIIESIDRVIEKPGTHSVFNIGNGTPILLMEFVQLLEKALGQEAQKNYLPLQPGDMLATWADTSDLEKHIGYRPKVGLEEGIFKFADWYLREYA